MTHKGLSLGDDIRLVGFDDQPWAEGYGLIAVPTITLNNTHTPRNLTLPVQYPEGTVLLDGLSGK